MWISVIAIFIGGCAETLPTSKSSTKFNKTEYENNKDAANGARLYGEWWDVLSYSTPNTPPPLWAKRIGANPQGSGPGSAPAGPGSTNGPVQGGGTDGDVEAFAEEPSGSTTWACATCHGWDYSGSAYFTANTSLMNLENASNPALLYEFIRNGIATNVEDTPHRFGQLSKTDAGKFLSKQDIYDLTAFIIEVAGQGVGDISGGDTKNGAQVYSTFNGGGCESVGCHRAGSEEIGPAELRDMARDEPDEVLHFVRFGGSNMPAGESPDNVGAYLQQAKDVLAFLAGGGTGADPVAAGFSDIRYNDTSKKITDFKQGGLLYDKWWKAVPSATEPTQTHPLWPATNTSKTGSATWRCKQCHGWDYRGKDGQYASGSNASGIRGIVDTDATAVTNILPGEVFAYLKTDSQHGFAGKFSDEDYYALTRFVIEIRSEVAQNKAAVDFIDDETGRVIAGKYNIDKGSTLYASGGKCAACHGIDGKSIDFEDGNPALEPNEFVDTIAKENPWEFVHKARFGDLDGSIEMPGLIDPPGTNSAISNAIDILAYAQSTLVPDTKRAGRLYDNWMTEKNVAAPPIESHPLWPTTNVTKTGKETWRCKNCHGWDYKGANGIKGFFPANNRLLDKTQTATFIKNGDNTVNGQKHQFAAYLSDEDINALAEFITKAKTNDGIYDFAAMAGSASQGQAIYKGVTPGGCQACHGTDGTQVPNVDLGALAKSNPAEVLHKSRFGSPASTMIPSSTGFKGLSPQEAANVLAYATALSGGTASPTYDNASMVRGGRLYDKWWVEMRAGDPTVVDPTVANPKWASRDPSIPNTAAVSDTWRCKTCHGWNYRGIGFLRGNQADDLYYKLDLVLKNSALSPTQKRQVIYDWIKNGANNNSHNFGTSTALVSKLGDREVWDLTKFFFEGIVNTDMYIYATEKSVRSFDIANGTGLYSGSVHPSVNCSSCHGADGRGLVDKGTNTADIFFVAKDDPWEFFHKVRVGQPGTAMPALLDPSITLTDKDGLDVLGYAQDAFAKRP